MTGAPSAAVVALARAMELGLPRSSVEVGGQPAVRFEEAPGTDRIVVLGPGDEDALEQLLQLRASRLVDLEPMMSGPVPAFDEGELQRLRAAGIGMFADRFLEAVTPGVSEAKLTELAKAIGRSLPSGVKDLWRFTAQASVSPYLKPVVEDPLRGWDIHVIFPDDVTDPRYWSVVDHRLALRDGRPLETTVRNAVPFATAEDPRAATYYVRTTDPGAGSVWGAYAGAQYRNTLLARSKEDLVERIADDVAGFFATLGLEGRCTAEVLDKQWQERHGKKSDAAQWWSRDIDRGPYTWEAVFPALAQALKNLDGELREKAARYFLASATSTWSS